MRYLLHSLQTPASRYVPDDEIFAIRQIVTEDREKVLRPASAASPKVFRPDLTLGDTTSAYNTYLVQTERQGSTRDETARVLRWLQEEIDPSTPVSVISHDQMRDFGTVCWRWERAGKAKGCRSDTASRHRDRRT